MKKLIVDGMLSGTGVRDEIEGGYIDLQSLAISSSLQDDFARWLEAYADAHYRQYADQDEVVRLDNTGLDLAARLQSEVPEAQVGYYSNGEMRRKAR
jgi:hypothetical protein